MKVPSPGYTAVFSVVLWLCCAVPALGGPGDGSIVGPAKLVDHGPDSDVPTLVFLAEGYHETELAAFADDVGSFVDAFLATPPFDTTCHVYNIWRVDIASAESGADDPAACAGGTGTAVATYFDATFCADGSDRGLLAFDRLLAQAVLDDMVPHWDAGVVLVNSDAEGTADANPAAVTIAGAWIEGLITGLLPPNQPPACDAGGPYLEECAGEVTPVTLVATNSTDPDCDPLTFVWTGPFVESPATGETVTVDFPGVGVYAVLLEVSDGTAAATCEAEVVVQDTTPPDLAVMVTPYVLWPPNHKLNDIEAEVTVHDICDAEIRVRLVSITSTEPDNGRGDGNTGDDIHDADLGTDDRAFALRAERSGRGEGRVYVILYQAEDAGGNLAEVEAFVVVPKSRGRNGFPCLPEAPVPLLPEQAGRDDTLHYRWQAEPCATWYELWVNRNGRLWHQAWHRKGHGSGFIHEFLEGHPAGRYDWWVRAWGPGGMGPWSAGPAFTLSRPSGLDAFAGDEVALSWEEAAGVRPPWRQFWIAREGRPFWKRWVPDDEVVVDGSAHTFVVPRTLPLGRYRWWHRTFNGDGMGRWAEGDAFEVGRIEVLEPEGTVPGSAVAVVWDDTFSVQAAWYQLWIGREGARAWSRWVPRPATTLAGSDRSLVIPDELPPGDYELYVRGWQPRAFGPWSSPQPFTVGGW